MKASAFIPVSLGQFCVLAFFASLAPANAQESAARAAAAAAANPAPASAPIMTTVVAAPAPAEPTASIPTIFVCGDSTANSGGRIQGWGTPLADYFDRAKAFVDNQGQAGTSSRTYYNGRWRQVVQKMKSGDYMLLVFGINDGLGSLAGKGATQSSLNGIGDETADANGQTVHTYGWYLAKMASEAQEKGVHVYLLTVTARNIWNNPKAKFNDAKITSQEEGYNPAEDKIERGTGNGQYTQWTKDLGAKLHLPVLDLTNLEGDRHEKMGREKVTLLYQDHNHTFPPGADIVAQTITSGLKAFKDSPFTALLSEKGKALETAGAKYVAENPVPPAADAKPAASTTK